MNKGKLRSLMFHAGFCNEDGGWDDRPIHEQEHDNFQKFAELIVRECIKKIHYECEDFANGNCFNDNQLWESVTREYGRNNERGFDPIGMSIHFEKIINQHFGVEE